MKIGKLLLTAVIALGLMACNNEDGPELPVEKNASISIKVFPSSKSGDLRATGDLSGNGVASPGLAAESAIKKLEVWIFMGDVLDAYKAGEADAYEVTEIEARIGARQVVVAANANIGQVNSKAELLAKLAGLPNIANGLVMTAEPFNITLEKGKNYWGYTGTDIAGEEKYHEATPLAITRVNARVALINATLDVASIPANQKPIFDALTDVEVAMFNVPNQTKLFGAPLAVTGTDLNYVFGAKWPSPSGTYEGAADPTATATAGLTDEVEDALPVVVADAPYYYVNECIAEKMFIVLRAKLSKEGAAVDPATVEGLYTDGNGYTYYPVWVNKDGLAAAGPIVRNTQYNISLTIKGLGNPTIDEVEKAWLDVAVEVAEWDVVEQNVTWE